ncbi:MAG: 4Fe-4S binding protein [Candidatus Aminicenantes bacterium]|nr:4Fe-4S binding protein [Candidatus Aminicenantes bacterium]
MNHQFYHAHQIIEERCKARMKCLHICPTQAIRVRNGKVIFLNELCIDCGECINICPENAFVPIRDEIEDFSSFKFQIAFPSSMIYTQFGPDIHPKIIHQALKNIGFDEVIHSTDVTHELGFLLLHHLTTQSDIRPLISSYCPAIVRLLQVSYPNLVNHIGPFDVPREIIAKQGKQKYSQQLKLKPEEIGIIYITPCPAKIVSIKQPAEKEHSWIDGAIPIKDIYNLILPEIIKIQEDKKITQRKDFCFSKNWGILGNLSQILGPERCLSVAGISHAKKIFDDIESSRLRNVDFIEALACMQGCVGGAFCVENPYIARHNSILMEKKYGTTKSLDKDKILQKNKYYMLEHPILPRFTWVSEKDIAASIKKMRQKERILVKLPQKDCGICGAPTCETFAEDCARGEADLTDCVFFS